MFGDDHQRYHHAEGRRESREPAGQGGSADADQAARDRERLGGRLDHDEQSITLPATRRDPIPVFRSLTGGDGAALSRFA
jgi:hypothetical protein